jgi:hypothetical protein
MSEEVDERNEGYIQVGSEVRVRNCFEAGHDGDKKRPVAEAAGRSRGA